MDNILSGKKSYIAAAILFIIGGLSFTGVITPEQANSAAIMVGGFLGFSLRSAIKKVE